MSSALLPVKPNPEVVIESARIGGMKAIFCEKPMAARLSDADAMVDECRSRGIHFSAGDAYRNFEQVWQARAMMRPPAGQDASHTPQPFDLGEVRSIHLYQATDEISGGGCQGLSVTRMFAWDSDVDWLTGWVRDDPYSNYDQGMGGLIRFRNGIEAYVDYYSSSKKGIEVICTKGFFFTDWYTFRVWKSKTGKETNRFDELEEAPGYFAPGIAAERKRDSQGRMIPGKRQMDDIQSIVDAIEKGIELRCSGGNMRKVLEITLAMRESARRNQAPVRVPLEDRSLAIYPHVSRWLNKKEVFGAEKYAQEIGRFDKEG
ncbi:MAG: Gfo/Idh/MocA family oxidoreductase [SAR202 cluster bacterium]|nr:Gfo/Idh/MocA family oxidoreductase [SAR202 cluster bacterium]